MRNKESCYFNVPKTQPISNKCLSISRLSKIKEVRRSGPKTVFVRAQICNVFFILWNVFDLAQNKAFNWVLLTQYWLLTFYRNLVHADAKLDTVITIFMFLFFCSQHFFCLNPSGGLHSLNLLTGKLNRYILYRSPQTQKPQVAASLNPELTSSCCSETIYASNTKYWKRFKKESALCTVVLGFHNSF